MSKDIKIALAVPDLKLRDILVYLLKAWEYSVDFIEEKDDILNYIKLKSPNLIIIDVSFNDDNGLKICQDIKSDFLTSYTPTIILIDKRQLRRDLLNVEQGVDDYLIKPPDPIDLEIRIILALRSAAHNFNANALTKLPGNKLIERELAKRISAKKPFSFQYIDINNFKPYNDKYGHIRGDKVIVQTAGIISNNVKSYGSTQDFVGHIGGDDFVIITSMNKAEQIAKETIRDFDSTVANFYSDLDKRAGFIAAKDRSGNLANIPLMSLSIAIINSSPEIISNIFELTDKSTELKNYLKKLPGSNFMIDRRTVDKGITNREFKL
jgi:diguanylate cyclase (GGDEF)-like protein